MTAALAYVTGGEQARMVDVLDRPQASRDGAVAAQIDRTIAFDLHGLQAFFFSQWDTTLVDLMVVSAAIEFCDAIAHRPALGWARSFDVTIAVHDPSRWLRKEALDALTDAASFLTGDVWSFSFVDRRAPLEEVRQQHLDLPSRAQAIVPYSNGLDSRAVATLLSKEVGDDALVRVRLGVGGSDLKACAKAHRPFTVVPYDINFEDQRRRESSGRSRGFKFAVVTGVAAHLANIDRVIVTESGQGALGPALAVSGQAYPDFRVHPCFTRRLEALFEALLGRSPRFEFPRLWSTKAETIRAAVDADPAFQWTDTRSCWRSSRWVSVDGERRQCGACAACMLRRMSLHAAGLEEPVDRYVYEDLNASEIADGTAVGYDKRTSSFDQYAVAGVLHLDHLARLATAGRSERTMSRAAREIAIATGDAFDLTHRSLLDLFARHRDEWTAFLKSLRASSFVRRIALSKP